MGAVYRVTDRHRDCTVALKRLRIEEGQSRKEERVALFHREFRTLAELEHPRVIHVYDYGIDDLGPYYTMELLDGADLREEVPISWRRACLLMRDVCSCLALLHSRGFVHRDVSPLNVRCTADGRAKLIDFGAMAPIGVSVTTLGTPPCVAPEAHARLPLDARTDLFALAATFYYALTGTHAYPARTLAQLPAHHARLPAAPSTWVDAEIPEDLDRLLMSMLSLDPMARPRHASEVMERLTAMAELEPVEPLQASQAYLDTPALVGRDETRQALLEHLKRIHAARSRSLRVHGEPGVGRSRVLQAATVEARLMGMTVLQGNPSEGSEGDYAVVRPMLDQLRRAMPELEPYLGRHAEVLSPLLGVEPGRTGDGPGRKAMLRSLCTLVVRAAKQRALLLVVDDVDRCDEGSLAVLATLASSIRSGRFGVLVADLSGDARDNKALGLLHELCTAVELLPLSEVDTQGLLQSVFGEIPNLPAAARYISERAAGNPRATMELAQALVDRGLARYELGSWTLPAHLASHGLPASLSEVRRERLRVLSEDARSLAEVLAVSEPYGLALQHLVPVTNHRDDRRLATALDHLVQARIIDPLKGDVLSDRAWTELLHADMEPVCSLVLHRRLASVLRAEGHGPIALFRCLIRGGDPEGAVVTLGSVLAERSLVDEGGDDYPDLVQEAAQVCAHIGRERELFFIQRELVRLADRFLMRGMPEHFAGVLATLSSDSGLDDFYACEGEVPEDKRLDVALTRAQRRYDEADPALRRLPPLDALRALVETVYAAAVHAAVVGDLPMLDRMPSLAPFRVLSPAIAVIEASMHAQRDLIGARYEQVLEAYQVRLAALDESPGLTSEQIARSRRMLLYALGNLCAGLGIEGALEHAETLDGLPEGETLAASVRQNYCVRQGDLRGAERWRRHLELLQVQHKRPHALKLRQTTQQIETAAHADDLESTKRNLDVLEELAEIYPSAMPYVHFGRAEYERIRGNHRAGLEHIRVCLSQCKAAEHGVWPWAAASEVKCLQRVEGLETALQVGMRRMAEADEAGLGVMREHIEHAVVELEARLGRYQEAVERLDVGIAHREQYGMRGLNLGHRYEIRARIAVWMGDHSAFQRSLVQCAANYRGGKDNPALAARYQALLQEGRARWPSVGDAMSSLLPVATLEPALGYDTSQATLQKTLAGTQEADERARLALAELLTAAGQERGQLYLLKGDQLELVASRGADDDLSEEISLLLHGSLESEGDEHGGTMATATMTEETEVTGQVLFPFLLSCADGNNTSVAIGGVAMPELP
ncbi:MAG: AAA family ATPase, partial [Myxococcales bacterium]|nr:AAA family ATPase [Myxococcales bacterium]